MFDGLGKHSGQTIYMSTQIGPCQGICRKRNFDFHFHCRDTVNFVLPYACIGKPFICNVCYVSGRGQRDDLYQTC